MDTTVRERIILAALAAVVQATRDMAPDTRRQPSVERRISYTEVPPAGANDTLLLYAGADVEKSRDGIGQTYQFEILVRIWRPEPPQQENRRDWAYDTHAGFIIAALEDCDYAGGLGKLRRGAEYASSFTRGLGHIEGPFISVLLEYSRELGAPDKSYTPVVESQLAAIQAQQFRIV